MLKVISIVILSLALAVATIYIYARKMVIEYATEDGGKYDTISCIGLSWNGYDQTESKIEYIVIKFKVTHESAKEKSTYDLGFSIVKFRVLFLDMNIHHKGRA